MIVFFRRFKNAFTSLRARLAVVVAVSFLPAVLAILHDHVTRERRELEEAAGRAELSIKIAAENYEGRFESARQVLIALSQMEPIRRGERASCERELSKFLSKYKTFLNLGVVRRDGGVLASAIPFRGPLDVSDRSYFQRVMEKKDFSIGDFQIGRVTGKESLNCAYPILNDAGVVDRVLFVSLDLQFFTPRHGSSPSFFDETQTLIDSQGNVLASSRPDELRKKASLPPGLPFPTRVESVRTRDSLYVVAPVLTRPPSGLRIFIRHRLDDLFYVARLRLYQNLGWMVFSLAVASLFSGWVGDYFITRHVERILKTTSRLTAGDLSARTGVGNDPGELADLARAVDTMAERLQQRNAELEESRGSLENQVESRTRELAESNRQLESFSFSISHDLRAPLRAIDGFSQILLNEHASSLLPEGRRVLELVVKNSKHMAQLIDDLLAFSRLGRQEVVGIELNMNELVRDVYLDLTTPAGPRKVDFTIAPLPTAVGDSSMIRQVWTNLIENAIKFSSHATRSVIEVGAHKGDRETTYYVKDNGVGFDPRFSGKLFQVFQRLHGSSQFNGTGVGLAIVHRIIQKHGGRVWAESRPNQGAQFFFTLPASSGRVSS